jgi:mRNA interferase HicA
MRHGSCHDIYHNTETGRSQPVPRYRKINEILAQKILKDLTKQPD